MSKYVVDIIFEPTGQSIGFNYDAESDNESDLINEILGQLSIVSWKDED